MSKNRLVWWVGKSVPFHDKSLDGTELDLKLWAGFMSASENAETHALKPQIGWFVTKSK